MINENTNSIQTELEDINSSQPKQEPNEYSNNKTNTTHNVHTPEFIYSTGDKQKDEEKIQNIISKSSGSLAKNPNHTISIKEFKRRFQIERDAHKAFYGSNQYINAMHDAFIQASILNRVKYKEQYNTPKAIEISNQLGYKPAYEDTSLYPQYATNTLPSTLTDGITNGEIRIPEQYKSNFDYLYENLHLDENLKKELIEYEGKDCDYPYLDTKGLITFGIGFNLLGKSNYNPKEEECLKNEEFKAIKKLKPLIRDTNKLATDEEIWQAIENLSKERIKVYKKHQKTHPNDEFFFNIPAYDFKNKTNLKFKQSTTDKIYKDKIQNTLNLIKIGMKTHNKKALSNADYTAIPDIENLPIPVFMALIDIAYNSGYGGWKNLNNALAKKDYITASKEAHRKDNNSKDKNMVKRNKRTQQRFLDIAKNH